jgi:hypothetical protein
LVIEHREDLADVVPAFHGVTQRAVGPDPIRVAPAFPQSVEVARVHQIADDPLRGPLGDSYPLRHIAQPQAGIAGDAHQSVSVVGQERPFRHSRSVRRGSGVSAPARRLRAST